MRAAVTRILAAVDLHEHIVLFGDYDVDGVTSLALLDEMLRAYGATPQLFLPLRMEEGYGLSQESVERCLEQYRPQLLVALDCGTAATGKIRELKKRGVDVIVLDHHEAKSVVPDCVAVVNPKTDLESPFHYLCSVGIVFKLCHALLKTRPLPGFDLKSKLDLVALGTVADVVPLTGLNRAFVAKGLIALRRRERPGHVSLMDVARLSGPPEAWHLGFLLGPRINAGGRIGRADLGVRLLLENDPIEAAKIAAELDRLNRERQAIEQETLAQAEAEADAALGVEDQGAVIVTAAEGWHPGIVGLVAARLKEKFGRPAFAIALEPGGIGTGSGRSIPGVDIGRAVRRAVAEGLLVKGGGHAMAAGATLRRGALAELRAYLETTLAPDVEKARRASGLLIDGAVTAAAADGVLLAMISRAGPFGSGNPEPIIALPAHTITYAEEVGQAHMRVRLKSGDGAAVNAIAFRAVGQKLGIALRNSRGRQVHAAGCFALDRWQGEERVQFKLTDVAPAEPFTGA